MKSKVVERILEKIPEDIKVFVDNVDNMLILWFVLIR